MRLSRRHLVGLGAAIGTSALLSGCESLEQRLTKSDLPADAFALPTMTGSPAVRLLNRAAYGPRPGEVARVSRLGAAAYVEEQLAPDTMQETAVLTWRLRALNDTLDADAGTLFDEDDRRAVATLRQAALLRAVYSRRQLFERMVEFWTDHFNIYAFKGQGPQLKVVDDRETIRRHALGRFRDLLGASAKSAAMLGYLDNARNVRGVPNENYARELMELHTLGVHGGYTQTDVQEVARCFTGWTSEVHWHRGRFLFDPSRHDDGPKRALGVAFPAGGGAADGERVLDALASHPATAHHLARKLCRHFLGDTPNTLVNSLAATYLANDGEMRPVLRALLLSPELMSGPPILKRPLDYAVSALRALNADTDGGSALQDHFDKMGQPLFAWPMPDGFPDTASAWTGDLIPRWNFALALAGGQMESTTVDWDALARASAPTGVCAKDALLELVFGVPAAAPALSALRRCPAHDLAEFGAMAISSPLFQWR